MTFLSFLLGLVIGGLVVYSYSITKENDSLKERLATAKEVTSLFKQFKESLENSSKSSTTKKGRK